MPQTVRNPNPEISERKSLQTTIGDLRKLYGADFAKGCADNEKIADVVQRRPSFMKLIRYYETKRNEGKRNEGKRNEGKRNEGKRNEGKHNEGKHSETTIGELRRLYGPEFAKGCEDSEKMTDAVERQPSLTRDIRCRELKRFEQI